MKLSGIVKPENTRAFKKENGKEGIHELWNGWYDMIKGGACSTI